MAKNTDILTIQDIESFLDRVRATVAAANESRALKEALGRLITAHAATAPAAPKAAPRGGKRAAAKAAPAAKPAAGGGRRGRTARVSDQDILDLLKNAGAAGLGMRDLEGQLKQHPETIRLKLRNLRQQGQVQTTGPRNQLRYHAAGVAVEAPAAPAAPAAEAPAAPGKSKAAKGGKKAAAKAKTPAAKGGARKKAEKAPRAQGASSEAFEQQVFSIVQNGGADGVQMSTFSAQLKSDPKTIRKALDALKQAGKITVTGHRRSTKYHLAG